MWEGTEWRETTKVTGEIPTIETGIWTTTKIPTPTPTPTPTSTSTTTTPTPTLPTLPTLPTTTTTTIIITNKEEQIQEDDNDTIATKIIQDSSLENNKIKCNQIDDEDDEYNNHIVVTSD